MIRTPLYLTKELASTITFWARRRGKSKSAMVRELIDHGLEEVRRQDLTSKAKQKEPRAGA